MEKVLLRPSEAAELLGLCRSKVYMLMADGTLPTVRIGKSVRVPVEPLRKWIAGQVVATTANASKAGKGEAA